MKRLISAILLSAIIALCGCGQGTSSLTAGGAALSEKQNSVQKVEFKGVELEIPKTWNETEVDKGSIEAASFWRYEGEEDSSKHGYLLAYSELYETYGNTDTQVPDPTNPTHQKAKKNLDLGLKALDERVFIEIIAKSSLGDNADAVDQSSFRLEERDGHALWIVEVDTTDGKLVGYGIPLDDRMVAFFTASTKELSDEQKAVFDSLTVKEETDELILDMAKKIEGKSQDDAMKVIASYGEIPPSSDSDATGYKNNGPSGSNDKDTSTTGKRIGDDTYFETDDGDIVSFSDDGSVTQYNDLGVTTFNSDGSKEWTDGWGTVMRDENGDGEPDYVSYDSGETWQRVE